MLDVKNILVFPCGSEVSLEIHESVRYSRFFHLIGASSVDDHGRFVFPDYIGDLPFIDDPGFIAEFAKAVKDYKVDAVMPAMDLAISVLKKNEDRIGCRVVAPPSATCDICLSKRRTYEMLRGTVPVPADYSGKPINELVYPVFVKPEIGYGSRGAARIDTFSALSDHLSANPECMVLEYLPGEEYTIDCFTNRNGELLYCAGRTRQRVRNGISVRTCFPECQLEFEDFAERVNHVMNMRGAWFIQVRRDGDGVLRLLEVAARLGGSSALSRARGANLALMSLFDSFGYDISVCLNGYNAELDRALRNRFHLNISYRCAFIDYDDCLVFSDGTINLELVAFIYQCINKGVEVTLLSRHEGDLNSALFDHRLANAFDRVIHVRNNESKADYIERENSVFIDDSFAERVMVHNQLGIPVFSPDMVSCLIER